jgi:hypothetical protein
MADQTTSYVIQVTDGVDPSIERKLTGITTGASSAGSACAQLQASIDSINGRGLSAASNAIRDAGNAQRSLSTTTAGYSRSAQSATTATNNLSNSMVRFETQVVAVDAALTTLVATSAGYAAVASAISQATNRMAAAQQGGAAATSNFTGGTRQMSAALRVAQGNISGSTQLAARFLSTLVGGSPIIQAAFSVLGAVALVAVLFQVAEAIANVIKLYREMGQAGREATLDTARLAADGIDKIKPQVSVTEAIVRKLHGQSLKGTEGYSESASGEEQLESRQKALLASQNALNEAGLKGSALYKQKQKDTQAEIALVTTQIGQMKEVASSNAMIVYDHDSSQAQVKNAAQQYQSATIAVKNMDNEVVILQNTMKAQAKIEAVDAVKDDAKAARLAMQQLERQFKDYETTLGHKMTAPEGLAWWQSAEAGMKRYSNGLDMVKGKEAPYDQAIASRNDTYLRLNESLDEQVRSIGSYSDAQKIANDITKETLAYQKLGQPLTAAETTELTRKYSVIQKNAQYQAELNAEYTTANGPQRTYVAQQQALNKLLDDGAITVGQFSAQMNLADRAFENATNPLAEINRSIAQTRQTFGFYGNTLEVVKQTQDLVNASMNTTHPINMVQAADLQRNLTLLQQQQLLQTNVNALYEQNAGAMQKLVQEQLALNDAQAKGIITQQQYQSASVQNKIQQAQQTNKTGNGTLDTTTLGAVAGIMKGYTNLADGATKSFDQFFTTLDNGFADSIAHVLVFGGSIKKALGDVARQAVAGLISSLIKLGIQWVINATIGKALEASTVASTAATAGAVATAWAPAAAFSSLATLGTNAVAADAAIGTTTALAAGLSFAGHFATGGEVRGPGTSTSDSIPALLSTGEYVVNASAYAAHREAVQAINSGARQVYSVAGNGAVSSGSGSGARPMQVNVVHDGSVAVQVIRGTTPDEVQVIAKQTVYKHADEAVSQSIPNPNSKTRKAMSQHTNVRSQS